MVSGTNPADSATDVAIDSNIEITFSEPATVTGEWFEMVCATSGTYNPSGTCGSRIFMPLYLIASSSGAGEHC